MRNAAAATRPQRAEGRGHLAARTLGGRTRIRELYQEGAAKIRLPDTFDASMEAVIINTAGGLTGGDRMNWSVAAGPDTRIDVTTQACEKIYKASAGTAEVTTSIKVGAHARVDWLPQETILFDRARLSRRIDVDLADTASLLLCEIVVFGRAAMGERMLDGEFVDRWRLRRGGRLVFAETVRLDGGIGEKLSKVAVARGGTAVGTALIVPGDEALVQRVREISESFRSEVGLSAWNGFAMARFCAQDAAELRADMAAVLGRASGSRLPRLWLS
jgi:urease accessory protein